MFRRLKLTYLGAADAGLIVLDVDEQKRVFSGVYKGKPLTTMTAVTWLVGLYGAVTGFTSLVMDRDEMSTDEKWITGTRSAAAALNCFMSLPVEKFSLQSVASRKMFGVAQFAVGSENQYYSIKNVRRWGSTSDFSDEGYAFRSSSFDKIVKEGDADTFDARRWLSGNFGDATDTSSSSFFPDVDVDKRASMSLPQTSRVNADTMFSASEHIGSRASGKSGFARSKTPALDITSESKSLHTVTKIAPVVGTRKKYHYGLLAQTVGKTVGVTLGLLLLGAVAISLNVVQVFQAWHDWQEQLEGCKGSQADYCSAEKLELFAADFWLSVADLGHVVARLIVDIARFWISAVSSTRDFLSSSQTAADLQYRFAGVTGRAWTTGQVVGKWTAGFSRASSSSSGSPA